MIDKETIELLGIKIADIEEQVVQEVAGKITEDIGRGIAAKLKANAQAQVERQITIIVAEVATQEFQPTNSWVEKRGAPTTIRDMMKKSIEEWWKCKVDSRGIATDNYSAKMTRAEYYAKSVVGDYVGRELKSEMKAIVEAGREKVRQAMAEAVANQIKRIW